MNKPFKLLTRPDEMMKSRISQGSVETDAAKVKATKSGPMAVSMTATGSVIKLMIGVASFTLMATYTTAIYFVAPQSIHRSVLLDEAYFFVIPDLCGLASKVVFKLALEDYFSLLNGTGRKTKTYERRPIVGRGFWCRH